MKRILACALSAALSLPAADLTVTRVVLYKNGVAYFERSGSVPAGEAAWMPPGTPQAVVSLERQATEYLDFAVVPATEPTARDLVGSAFPSPRTAAYDIVLLRVDLNRGEESDLASVTGPAFLYVSSGRITLEDARGDEIDLEAGDVAEFTGEAVAVGVGRAPASFLVAMIGAIVLTLRERPGTRRQDISAQVSRSGSISLENVPVGAGVKELGIRRPAQPEVEAPKVTHDAGHGHGGHH